MAIKERKKEVRWSENKIALLWMVVMGILTAVAARNETVRRFNLPDSSLEKAQMAEVALDPEIRQYIQAVTMLVGGYKDIYRQEGFYCNGSSLDLGVALMAGHCLSESEKLYYDVKVSRDGGRSWLPGKFASFSQDKEADLARVFYDENKTESPRVRIARQDEVKRGETVFVSSYLPDNNGNYGYYLTPVEVLGWSVTGGDTELMVADLGSRSREGEIKEGRSGSCVFTRDGACVAVLYGVNKIDDSERDSAYREQVRQTIRSFGFDKNSFKNMGRAHILVPTYPELAEWYRRFSKKR